MDKYNFSFEQPLVCTAIHNGHTLSPNVLKNSALTDLQRQQEEDPHTGFVAKDCPNHIIVDTSRFECDLNRRAHDAIYLQPQDAWGLNLHKAVPDVTDIAAARCYYNNFYSRCNHLFTQLSSEHKRFFVYDLHSYNHRRAGIDAPPDDPKANPEIIIGTSNMPQEWLPLVELVVAKLRAFDFNGRQLDVRVNVKFPGGNFGRWIHTRFAGKGCCISLEFKKIFMNEWTGELDQACLQSLKQAVYSTFSDILAYLQA